MSNFFFFNDTATTEIYTLSLHDALPISVNDVVLLYQGGHRDIEFLADLDEHLPPIMMDRERSEEHTSELQSRSDLVCRLLLEKKKKSSPAGKVTQPRPPYACITSTVLYP